MDMNCGIEFWRFIFTCIVCLLHFETAYFGGSNKYFACGYLGVEFFFILSGFMLMKHARNHDESAVKYLFGRIKRFIPSLWISYGILIINYAVCNKAGVGKTINEIYKHIWEYLFLNCMGISWEIWNGATWYISALLITSYFIYWLVKTNEKNFVEFIGPLLIFFIYSWYAYLGKGLDSHLDWERICTSAISRAVGGLSIGCILFYANDRCISKKKINVWVSTSIEMAAVILIGINIICAEKNSFNLLVLLLYPVVIVFEYNRWNIWNKYLSNNVVKALGKISIDMYLNQVFFIGFFMKIYKRTTNVFLDFFVFLIGLVGMACILGMLKSVGLKYVTKWYSSENKAGT